MTSEARSSGFLSRRDVIAGLPATLVTLWLASIESLFGTAAAPMQRVAPAPLNASLVEDLVVANRILVDKGFLDTSGHVSVRHDRDPNRYLMAWRRAPELITADDVIEHDLDNNVIDAKKRPPYLERFIHTEIYRTRPDVNAVVHGHTPSLIAFSASSIPLQPLFGGVVFIGPSAPVFTVAEGGGIVSSPELGRGLAAALGKAGTVLMRNHGVVVVGPTLPALVTRAINLDINAQLQSRVLAMGDKQPVYLHPAPGTGSEGGTPETTREWEAYKRRAMILMKEQ